MNELGYFIICINHTLIRTEVARYVSELGIIQDTYKDMSGHDRICQDQKIE